MLGGDDPEPLLPVHAGGGPEVWLRGGLLLQAWGLARGGHSGGRGLPAREAARTQLRAVWYREELEEKMESRVGLIYLGGAWWPWPGRGWACSAWKVGDGPPWPGFAAAFLILLGFALLDAAGGPLFGAEIGAGFRKILARRRVWAAGIWPGP